MEFIPLLPYALAALIVWWVARTFKKSERRAEDDYRTFMRKHMTRGYFGDCGEENCSTCKEFRGMPGR